MVRHHHILQSSVFYHPTKVLCSQDAGLLVDSALVEWDAEPSDQAPLLQNHLPVTVQDVDKSSSLKSTLKTSLLTKLIVRAGLTSP